MLCLPSSSTSWKITSPLRACLWIQLQNFRVYLWNIPSQNSSSESGRLLLSFCDIPGVTEVLIARHPGSKKSPWRQVPQALCIKLPSSIEIILIPMEYLGIYPGEEIESSSHHSLITLSSIVMLRGLLKTVFALDRRKHTPSYKLFVLQCLRDLLEGMFPELLCGIRPVYSDPQELPDYVQNIAGMLSDEKSKAAFYRCFLGISVSSFS
jgi:hypothetical protein